MKAVRPKKQLGQHLTDLSIAEKIARTLDFSNYHRVLEIGPGMGVLVPIPPLESRCYPSLKSIRNL